MEEEVCDCGNCRSCDAHSMSDYDDESCQCGGGGCSKCEFDEI